jgi:hypothetical protein
MYKVKPIVNQVFHSQIKKITTLTYDFMNKLLFIGNADGKIVAYNIEENYKNINFNKKLDILTQSGLKVSN